MRVHSVVALRVTGSVLGLLLTWPGDLRAQHGSLRGTVVDTSGRPIQNADVGIAAHRKLTRTDEQGRFHFPKVPAGKADLTIRRLSYEPQSIPVTVTEASLDSIRVTMVIVPLLLGDVSVTATELRLRENIEDFYRRMTRGVGQYVSREDVEKRWGGKPSDLLRNTPGIRFVRVGAGRGVRFPTTSIVRRDCAPMIWIDGQKVPGLEIDEITLGDIEGIELYQGPATTPMQFSQGQGSNNCGTIVMWSRPAQYQRHTRKP